MSNQLKRIIDYFFKVNNIFLLLSKYLSSKLNDYYLTWKKANFTRLIKKDYNFIIKIPDNSKQVRGYCFILFLLLFNNGNPAM